MRNRMVGEIRRKDFKIHVDAIKSLSYLGIGGVKSPVKVSKEIPEKPEGDRWNVTQS